MGLWSYTPGSLSMRDVGVPATVAIGGRSLENERAPNISSTKAKRHGCWRWTGSSNTSTRDHRNSRQVASLSWPHFASPATN